MKILDDNALATARKGHTYFKVVPLCLSMYELAINLHIYYKARLKPWYLGYIEIPIVVGLLPGHYCGIMPSYILVPRLPSWPANEAGKPKKPNEAGKPGNKASPAVQW